MFGRTLPPSRAILRSMNPSGQRYITLLQVFRPLSYATGYLVFFRLRWLRLWTPDLGRTGRWWVKNVCHMKQIITFRSLYEANYCGWVGILSGKRDSNAHSPRSERDALPVEATARGNPGVYAS